jgi:hypothetical protein
LREIAGPKLRPAISHRHFWPLNTMAGKTACLACLPHFKASLTLFGLTDIFLKAAGSDASPSRTTIFRANQRELLERVARVFLLVNN